MTSRSGLVAVVLVLAQSACTDFTSKTDLLDQYPPFVMQVRLNEVFTDITGSTSTRRVFAYGFHPAAQIDDEHMVTSAVASGMTGGNVKLRIIMSKLLLGNTLQEIACRAPVNMEDGVPTIWDRVPVGDTPDDIANCSAQDQTILPSTCTGSKAVCICQIAGGCNGIAEGQPVGIMDNNLDGAADAQRLIPGSVGLSCSGIDVPINLNDFGVTSAGVSGVMGSYYDPSGFQQPPAVGGFEAMGPAIVLVPGKIVAGVAAGNPLAILPTGSSCHVTMTGVTDKTNVQPCTPVFTPPPDFPNCPEDVQCIANLNAPCAPGDLSQFTFGTEPLTLQPQSFVDGGTGVGRSDQIVTTADEVVIDPATAANVTMTENGAAFAGFQVIIDPQSGSTITIHPTAATGFAANATYTLTFETTFTDAFGKGPPAPVTFTFMTGP